jgi:hypothetical protein
VGSTADGNTDINMMQGETALDDFYVSFAGNQPLPDLEYIDLLGLELGVSDFDATGLI